MYEYVRSYSSMENSPIILAAAPLCLPYPQPNLKDLCAINKLASPTYGCCFPQKNDNKQLVYMGHFLDIRYIYKYMFFSFTSFHFYLASVSAAVYQLFCQPSLCSASLVIIHQHKINQDQPSVSS